MKIRITAAMLSLILLLSACSRDGSVVTTTSADTTAAQTTLPDTTAPNTTDADTYGTDNVTTTDQTTAPSQTDTPDTGDGNDGFDNSLTSLGAYDGYFEGESASINVECVSGTKNACKLEGTTLTFTKISEKTVYSISGKFRGNIVIDVGDEYKLELELNGLSIVCSTTNPITVISGDEVSIKAKQSTKNYVYDMRAAVGTDETLYSGAIHSDIDLEIGGKGNLTVVSENNNGIHSKDDLQVKNLTLFVACIDNALKGNDSVEITDANTTLIASGGDGIKTSASDISDKGNQRGTVTVNGGSHSIYAACDGIDAAYDVVIDGADTVIDIYTDKHSSYSKEVADSSSDVNYIRFSSSSYYYSVKYYNSETDYVWVNAEYHSKVSSGRTTYYYYSYPKMSEYAKVQIFIYQLESDRGQEDNCLAATDYLTPNDGCDTFAISSRGNRLSYSWTNYTTKVQEGGFGGGFGGMGGGNNDKGDHSTKGIKASNEITVNGGTVNIKSYDDAIHANNDNALENGETPSGNVTVNGGTISVYSNDDGIHADGTLTINSGSVSVINAYEGLEGYQVNIVGGNVSVISKDDGINATTTTGRAISISGGTLYIYCTGDGIDSNSRASYEGIVISGGNTVVISNSGMNSALDTENGYSYTGGSVIAIMPRGGMSSESTHCSGFDSVGKETEISLTSGGHLIVGFDKTTATVKMPVSISAVIIILGDNSPSVTTSSSTNASLDANGVCWN